MRRDLTAPVRDTDKRTPVDMLQNMLQEMRCTNYIIILFSYISLKIFKFRNCVHTHNNIMPYTASSTSSMCFITVMSHVTQLQKENKKTRKDVNFIESPTFSVLHTSWQI